MTDTTAGLALRSTDRATPARPARPRHAARRGRDGAVAPRLGRRAWSPPCWWRALVVANNPSALHSATPIANGFTQPASPPSYEWQAIDHLNATHPGTRVFAIPGNDFAAYRWGDTVDTPQPALLNRRLRHPRATDHGLDRHRRHPLRDRRAAPGGHGELNALAPMARLMSAGDVLVEYDQHYERYGVPQPQLLALQLPQTPLGLTDPVVLRHAAAQRLRRSPPSNEQDLAAPGNIGWPVADRHLHRARPAADAPGRVGHGGRRHGGRRHRAQQPGRRSACSTPTAPSTTPARSTPDPARLRDPRRPGRPARAHRHQPQAGVPLGHADRQRRLHRDAGREPGQDRPERQPDRALPGHDHHEQVVRHLRRRGRT